MPDFAEMPPYSTSIGAVTFGSTAVTRGFSRSQNDNAGGFGATSAPGGLLVQAPGLTVPMLWNRGSLYNLGLFGRGASLPALDAFDFFTGSNGIWWDAPQSWGRQNYLIRRPRTLIILDATTPFTTEAFINANYASTLAPLNVSVLLLRNSYSYFAAGIPFASSNTTESGSVTSDGLTLFTYSLPVTNEAQYVGGDCFIAQLQPDIFNAGPFNAPGNTNGYASIALATPPITPQTGAPLTNFLGLDSGTPKNHVIGCLNFTKAASDIAALNAGSAKFKTFQMILYQYNQNPYSSALLVPISINLTGPITPDPVVPSSNADTLLAGSTITRKTFTVGDSTTMLAQLLTDAVAFFPALP